jgi:rubredoxin-NAD+ reductase
MASAAEMARQLDAHVLAGAQVATLSPERHRMVAVGKEFEYAKLVLALGADPIRLSLAGDAASNILSVNDLSDYTRFRDALQAAKRVAILGAGLIGCEFANDLAATGRHVTLTDPSPWPVGRLLPEAAARALEAALADAGVSWRLGVAATRMEAHASAYRLTLSDGETLEADIVVSAVGLKPRIALAQEAGIRVGRGIVTNRYLQTSMADVFALGDCAEVRGLNLPYMMPMMHAARALAKTLAGVPTSVVYPAMPVVVKTPALPTVVAPPPPSGEGIWRVGAAERNVRAIFISPSGSLLGFALTGEATAERQKLAIRLPPALPNVETGQEAA